MLRVIPLAFLGVAMASACGGDQQEPLTPASGLYLAPGAQEEGVEQISNAQCKRAEACGQMGQGRLFSDWEQCKVMVSTDVTGDLRACREGVDQEDLDHCMAEIGAQECAGWVESLEIFAACDKSELCRD